MPYPYSGDTTVFGSSISLVDATARRDVVRASRFSSSASILGAEVWSSGFSALGSITTSSRVSSDATVVAAEVWTGTSGISLQGGLRSSGVTLDLRTNTVVVSLDTRANSSTMTIGQLRLVFAASGISLVYSSGASVYVVGQSSQSAAQA